MTRRKNMALQPIKKKRLFEEIILALEDYIEYEKVEPGEKLPSVNELSTLFNVSKTAVREALTVLHSNGIIESRAGVGIFLKGLEGDTLAQRVTKKLLNQQELSDILEFRRGIEMETAALASFKASVKEVAEIEK
ncbi:MAG TPA: GntR family transcriptional regulator, partial [Bacillales bacterium]|nr:GntR family transcriptional regulator [Bacillales bacterium]